MTSLYRFFSCSELKPETDLNRDIDALATSYLWFSRVEDFNDPFEGLYIEQLSFRDAKDMTDDELQVILVAKAKQNEDNLLEPGSDYNHSNWSKEESYCKKFEFCQSLESLLVCDLKRIKEDRHICCFNKNRAEDKVLVSKLMWSHYANGLRGMVIEFDGDALEASLEKLNDEPIEGGDIDYTGLDNFDAIELFVEGMKTGAGGVGKVLLRKSNEWEYEQEHRLVAHKNKLYYEPLSIRSIVLGQKMDSHTRDELISVAEKRGIKNKFQVAVINKKNFAIEVKDYDSSLFS